MSRPSMRLPHVQFKIGWMMVAVAIIALLLGSFAILRRRARLQGLADYHAEAAYMIRNSHGSIIRPNGAYVHVPAAPPGFADYHEAMAAKYSAALYPWLSVDPDPPLPK